MKMTIRTDMIMAVILLLFLFAPAVSGFSQNIPSTDIYKAIEKTDIGQAAKLPFYVLGWSRDGKFAYIKENSGGGRGGSIYTFLVMDSLTDKIIYQKVIDTYDFYSNDKSIDVDALMDNIVKNEIIPKYGIVYNPKVKFLTFPFRINGVLYTAEADVKKRPANRETDYTEKPVIVSFKLKITRTGTGTKTIRSANVDKNQYESIYVLGAIKSPFEEKIVVLHTFNFFNMCWGADLVPIVSGCKLDSGFK